jgi:uncharacterized protein YaiI (UPF0178 family)
VIKDILFKAADRVGVLVTLIANKSMKIPSSPNIKFVLVSSGLDVADNEIVKKLDTGDLVITADIPLAAEAIEKGGIALNPRGELYTTDNIKARLSMRDFMYTLRSSGVQTGGPSALSKNDRQTFANNLDKLLTKYIKKLT